MLGSWFSSKAHKQDDTRDEAQEFPSLPRRQSLAQPDSEKNPPRRAVTGALSNPHDAVLAQLEDRHLDNDSTRSSAGAETLDISQAEPQRRRSAIVSSALTDSSPVPETIYDPFTGSTLGILAPHASSAPDPLFNRSSVLEDPESTKDELWSHLTLIRELQSDIASMHVQMEGIGLSDSERKGKRRTPGVPSAAIRSRERESVWDTEGDGETGPEPEGDKEKKKARHEEFDKLADKFTGRKEAIGGIMTKLDELSQAVTTFHALRTPTIPITTSRTNTGSTSTTPIVSPGPSAPSPPIASPPPLSSSRSSTQPVQLPSSYMAASTDSLLRASRTTDPQNTTKVRPTSDIISGSSNPPILLTRLGQEHPVFLGSPASMDGTLPNSEE